MVNVSPMLSLILIVLGIITLHLSFWGLTKKKIAGAVEFSLFLLAVSVYALGYALEIAYTDLDSILLAVKFQYLGIPYMAYFAVLFSIRFILGKPLNRVVSFFMIIIPVMTTFLVLTCEYHSYYYIEPTVIQGPYFPTFSFVQGPFYKIRFIYQEIISLGAIIFLIIHFFSGNRERRPQIIAMITAQIIPGIVAVLYFYGAFPWGIDVNPFSSFIVGSIFGVAILKFGMFEIVPHGRVVALDSINEGFILFDRFGIVQDINRSAAHLPFVQLKVGSPLPIRNNFSKRLKRAIKERVYSFEYQYQEENDGAYFYRINLSDLSAAVTIERGLSVIIYDVTDERNLLDKLEFKATYDYLTNIRNRRALMESASKEVSRSRRDKSPVSFIMIDIDNFKRINDSYGHLAGDDVLTAVASALKTGLRDFDILGRYGGEEFLALCPNTDSVDGYKTAERLRHLILDVSVPYKDINLTVSCSFGLFTYKFKETMDVEKIINRADKALYNAKESGRNRVCSVD